MNNQPPDLSKLSIDRSTRPSSFRFFALGKYLLATTLILVAALIWFFSSNKDTNPPIAVSSTPAPAQPAGRSVLNATGYVVAQRKAAVASKATGRLAALYVTEGDVVKENQVLGRLESDDLAAVVRQEEAAVQAAAALVTSAEAELEESSLHRDRSIKLRKQAAVSQSEYDAALARFRRAQAALHAAQANVAVSRARLERAKVDLAYTEILAPFDGTVLTKDADVGEIVAPFGAATSAKAAIVTLADMESLEVEADVSEANLQKVYVGQQADITLDSLPDKTYRGTVHKIVPTVDRAKGTVLTKIRFRDKDEKVIPEMSAKVTFILNTGT